MAIDLLTNIMNSWSGVTGDMTIVAMGILVFFLLAFILVGIDFRFAMFFTLPLAVVFTAEGWFSPAFSVFFWIITLGLGGFLVWTMLSDR